MARRAEIPALTGLRGIAALCIVLNHYAANFAPFAWDTAPPWLMTVFSTSGFGMTLFFTLSGFVITYNYFDFPWADAPLRSLVRFGWLRFSRLYPLLFVFMLLRTDWKTFDLWTLLHFAGVETWLPLKFAGAIPMHGRFNVSWSISVEFGLYIFFALAMIAGAFLYRRGKLHWLVGLAGAYALGMLTLIAWPQAQQPILSHLPSPMEPLTANETWVWLFYQSPYYRVVEFALGACAAVLVMRSPPWLRPDAVFLHLLPAAGIAALFVVHWQHFPGLQITHRIEAIQLVTAVVCALVMLTGRLGGWLATGLSWRPLVLIGECSYSLYMMFLSAAAISGIGPIQQPFALDLLPWYGVRLAWGLLIALAVAWGFYRVVERPAQAALRAIGPQAKPATFREMPTLPQAAE